MKLSDVPFPVRHMTKAELVAELAAIGYGLGEREHSYTNNFNPHIGTWEAVVYTPIELDTGLRFCNVSARKDKNFDALQMLRCHTDPPFIAGKVWEI